jgi:four helix bundle protein
MLVAYRGGGCGIPRGVLNEPRKFDLEERTAKLGEAVIDFVKSLPETRVMDVLVKQIVRSATSVGANYMEADGASSKSDFKHKIDLCCKEAKETKHWLRMIARANPETKERGRILWQEAHALASIFASISLRCKKTPK